MGLSAIAGVKVGCYTDSAAQTGLTVILFPEEFPAVASGEVRGGAPGTRDTELLRPENTVESIHALMFSGGSAYGLDAASGVMEYLAEQGRGFQMGGNLVPVVPAAVIFDLDHGMPAVPEGEDAYRAAKEASSGPVPEGPVGAGTGARVGKVRGNAHSSRGGQGTSHLRLAGGGTVAVLAVVNAVGDVVADDARILAGTRDDSGAFLDTEKFLLGEPGDAQIASGENTTLAAVITDVQMNKAQCLQVARMAHSGLGRVIRPSHTPFDGDAVFVISCGDRQSTPLEVGTAAARGTGLAIQKAVGADWSNR